MVRLKKPKTTDTFFIGIDYGEKNIGLALGKNGLVTPLTTISGVNLNTAFHEILRFTLENKVNTFVVGLPLTADGKETKSSMKVRVFANKLKLFSKKQIVFQNEHATSKNADEEMIDFEISQKKRRTNDHFAAALILKQFFGDNGH